MDFAANHSGGDRSHMGGGSSDMDNRSLHPGSSLAAPPPTTGSSAYPTSHGMPARHHPPSAPPGGAPPPPPGPHQSVHHDEATPHFGVQQLQDLSSGSRSAAGGAGGDPVGPQRRTGEYESASSQDEDLAFNFDPNVYGFPTEFGRPVDDASDVDLLHFLASDTSIAFAHTLIPEYTTFTRPNSPGAAPIGSGQRRGTSHSSAALGISNVNLVEPSGGSWGSIGLGGGETPHVDFPQHASLSPKMAALWKNVMQPGGVSSLASSQEPSGRASVSVPPPPNGNHTSLHQGPMPTEAATPTVHETGANTAGYMPPEGSEPPPAQHDSWLRHEDQTPQPPGSAFAVSGVRSSSRANPPVSNSSAASDHHFPSDGRPQDAITEAKHLISDLASLVFN